MSLQGVDIVERRAGGERVTPGFYWSRDRWEIVPADGASGLPGTSADHYVRLPALAVLALGPFMGAAFAMFLPLAGFVLVIREIGARAARVVRRPDPA